MFSNIGSSEIVVIGLIILALFGTNKLNEFARGLGESAKVIKKIKKGLEDEL